MRWLNRLISWFRFLPKSWPPEAPYASERRKRRERR